MSWNGNYVIGAYLSVFHENKFNQWESACQLVPSKLAKGPLFSWVEIIPHTLPFYFLSGSSIILSIIMLALNWSKFEEPIIAINLILAALYLITVVYLGMLQQRLTSVKKQYIDEWQSIKEKRASFSTAVHTAPIGGEEIK